MGRFIAYLDILGFKDWINNTPLSQVRIKLDKLMSILDSITLIDKNARLDIVRFSDSIILITDGCDCDDFDNLILSIMYIQLHAIQLQIPIKGAISFGDLIFEKEKSLLLGKPLINAYLVQEDVKFIGVILDKSAQRKLDEINTLEKCETYKFIEVAFLPTKSGKLRYYHINYIRSILQIPGFDRNSVQTDIYKMYYEADLSARIYVDNTYDVFKKDLEI